MMMLPTIHRNQKIKKTSLNDNRILFVQPEMSKRETLAASHLEESKKVMKDTQEKFQNLRSSKTQTRKISENKMSKQNSFENVNEASKLSLPPLKISKKATALKISGRYRLISKSQPEVLCT